MSNITIKCNHCGKLFDSPTYLHRKFCSKYCGGNHKTIGVCKVDGCDKPHKSKGYCQLHYQRLKKFGDPYKRLCVRGTSRHGMVKTPTWYSWIAMIERGTSKRYTQYDDYMGRGITVCERWSCNEGFINFLEDMGLRPEGHTIDRIDNNGNYEPSNCKWSTPHEQNLNRRPKKVLV